MKCDFENFKKLNLDTACIALESTEYMYLYWCYPENCVPIGLEGCILYCFIEEYGVKEAVKAGDILESRYNNYKKML